MCMTGHSIYMTELLQCNIIVNKNVDIKFSVHIVRYAQSRNNGKPNNLKF